MSKICKIFGTIATVGAMAIAGKVLYDRGFDDGYDVARRDDDYDEDFGDVEDDDEDYDVKAVYCDNENHCLGFTYSEFIEAMKIIKAHDRASIMLLKNEMNISYDKAKALIQYFEDKGYIGATHGSQPREINMPDEDFNV